ncbi:hypothetical protein LCGC14_0421410 [marine sediment metagenome]|uniref:Uncharacterized protein n=1 Tax=marine sediment metagenome TaxID=412755 RepID=A0A0F9SWY4_9ZZZZ
MKKKIWIIVLASGWVVLIGFVLYSFVYKAQIAKHRKDAFSQGANAVQNNIMRQLTTQGFLRVTVDGENRILKLEEKEKQ